MPRFRAAFVTLAGTKLVGTPMSSDYRIEVGEEPPRRTRNLSTGGLLLQTRAAVPVGTRVQLQARIEGTEVEFTTGGR